MRRFELDAFLEAMDRYAITDLHTVPPMAVTIVKTAHAKGSHLRKTKVGRVGAAPLDRGVQAQLQSLLSDGAAYTQVWGMTETTCVATMFDYEERDDTGSVGRQLPNVEMK